MLASPDELICERPSGFCTRSGRTAGTGAERRQRELGVWPYQHDGVGSVRAVLDGAGAVQSTTSYDPWGVPVPPVVPPGVGGGSPAPFGFTGELHDGDLVHLRARWYHPSTGTFTSRDPFAGFDTQPYSLHPYQYAYSNPVLLKDPSGECLIFLSYQPAFVNQYHIDLFLDDCSGCSCPKPQEGVPYRPCDGVSLTIISGGPEIPDEQLSVQERTEGLVDSSKHPWGKINVRPGSIAGSDIGVEEMAFHTGPKVILVDDDRPCSDYTSAMFPYALMIDSGNYPYHPYYRNSNSLVSGVLESAGLSTDINHPRSVPGWGRDPTRPLNIQAENLADTIAEVIENVNNILERVGLGSNEDNE
ncbi:MAG: hypothetical protein GFH25_541198n112 [Chloroflexi bacterium AL-N10]|nr:hypothetical protein [Chloroflexi bacterium AL-N10]NOK76124.1 hypothetical protein [Chloroflexi bacterium AL-N5]